MGVVRDVTIDQLTQAVQGISSTGISDSTGQAINNTLSTLGKDASLQGIISAIAGLGQTLGSDKANISGDNIADKATFRQNIGASGVVVSDSVTTTTDASGRISADVRVESKSLRFWADGFIIGGYRKDGGVSSRTIVFIRNSDNTSPAANTSVTLKWDYISS